MHTHTNILILGAGIGGYETFRCLAARLKRHHLPHTITLVDRHNYFTFTPMHHEAATGSIEPVHCTLPLREIVADTPHCFMRAVVLKIHPEKKIVETSEGNITYDYCVVALGSMVNWCDVPGAKEYSHHVRTLPAAMALQRAIIARLEENKDGGLNIAIVGGGPTGTEMAGQLADFARHDVKKFYPDTRIGITLLEGGTYVLPRLPVRAQSLARKRLERYGAAIRVNCRVKEVRPDAVVLDDGEEIPADLTIWTAGFYTTAPAYLPASYCEKGRIPVTPYMHHNINDTLYAVGDIALAYNPGEQESHPQLGEAAHRHGQYVAKHIAGRLQKTRVPKFVFHSAGTLMAIGDWYGIAILGPFIFGGWFAWWLRRMVYVFFMPGVIRKLRILIDWTLHRLGPRYMVDVERR